MSDEFDWNPDTTVVEAVQAIAVYTNLNGDIVIRQQDSMGMYFAEEPFIVVPRSRVPDVIAAMNKELEG